MWNVNFVVTYTFKQKSWGHIAAIQHTFSILSNCFNEQQLNSLEDYMYIQASVSYVTI